MYRVTKRHPSGKGVGRAYYPTCLERCGADPDRSQCGNCNFAKAVCEQVAAYEDTGATPEMIVADLERRRNPRSESDRLHVMTDEDLAKFLASHNWESTAEAFEFLRRKVQ